MPYYLLPKRYLLMLLLMLVGASPSLAQPPALEPDPESLMAEERITEQGDQSIILDNTRTKIGRDFYDNFYREFALPPPTPPPLTPADSLLFSKTPQALDAESWVITIDETPSTSAISNIISISINDQLLWQQFVQARTEQIEEFVLNAVETVRQYIISYEDAKQQLQNEDQKGTGVF